jgi:hypothetical protein
MPVRGDFMQVHTGSVSASSRQGLASRGALKARLPSAMNCRSSSAMSVGQCAFDASDCCSTDHYSVGFDTYEHLTFTPDDLTLCRDIARAKTIGLSRVTDEDSDATIAATADRVFGYAARRSKRTHLNSSGIT